MKAIIKQGKLKIHDIEKYRRELSKFDEGEEVRVEIEKWFKKRSNPQNRYYWGVVIDILSFHTGYTSEELHEALKAKFLPNRIILDEEVSSTTKELTTAEFEEYMRKIRTFASMELDCYIPDPNEAPGGYAYKL